MVHCAKRYVARIHERVWRFIAQKSVPGAVPGLRQVVALCEIHLFYPRVNEYSPTVHGGAILRVRDGWRKCLVVLAITEKGHRQGLYVSGALACLIRPADGPCCSDHAGKQDTQYQNCSEQGAQTEAWVCRRPRRQITTFGYSRVVGVAEFVAQLSPPRLPLRDATRSWVETDASVLSSRLPRRPSIIGLPRLKQASSARESFTCWQPANAPILPGPDQSFHIDRRTPLQNWPTAVQQAVVLCHKSTFVSDEGRVAMPLLDVVLRMSSPPGQSRTGRHSPP